MIPITFLLNFLNIKVLNYLIECLNLLDNKYEEIEKIRIDFPLFRHQPKQDFLKEVIFAPEIDGASYTQRVFLFAQLEYFRNTDEPNSRKIS